MILANKMIDKKRLMKMWEEIKMLDIIEIAMEKGIEEGKTLGIQEGKTLGIQEGKTLGTVSATREMLLDFLLEKFGIVSTAIQEEIAGIDSLFSLKSLFRQTFKCADIEAFEGALRRLQGTQGPADESGKTSEIN